MFSNNFNENIKFNKIDQVCESNRGCWQAMVMSDASQNVWTNLLLKDDCPKVHKHVMLIIALKPMLCKSLTPVNWYLIPCSAEMPFIGKGLYPSIHCSIDFLPVVCWMYFQSIVYICYNHPWSGIVMKMN